MKTPLELRKHKRYPHFSIAMLEDEKMGYTTYAHTINSSGDGLGFGTDYPFRPGTELNIRIDKPPFKASPRRVHGLVKWCRAINNKETTYPYNIGVKIL